MRLASITIGIASLLACADADGVSHCEANDVCFEFDDTTGGIVGAGLTASLGTLCTTVQASLEAGPCPSEGIVGGCAGDEQEKYDYVEYQYSGTIEDIDCTSREVLVGPDGAPYEPAE